jgi:hypothetical protein
MTKKQALKRLEEIRKSIEAENISYGEIAELQNLVEYIDKSDVVLLEWAGVPEHKEETGDGFFVISRLHREDLKCIGYTDEQVDKITDSQMERIASKMSDDYCEQLYWSSLEIIAEYVLKGE